MKAKQVVIGAALAAMLLGGCADRGADIVDGLSRAAANEEQGTVTVGDMTISSEAKRPPNFPEEIPLPKDSVIVASMEYENGSSMMIFDANEPFKTVVQLYKSYIKEKGYTETMPITEDELTFWFSGKRDNENLVIILNKDEEREGRSSGTLTYQKSTKEQ